jgi:hypothetical protein
MRKEMRVEKYFSSHSYFDLVKTLFINTSRFSCGKKQLISKKRFYLF